MLVQLMKTVSPAVTVQTGVLYTLHSRSVSLPVMSLQVHRTDSCSVHSIQYSLVISTVYCTVYSVHSSCHFIIGKKTIKNINGWVYEGKLWEALRYARGPRKILRSIDTIFEIIILSYSVRSWSIYWVFFLAIIFSRN